MKSDWKQEKTWWKSSIRRGIVGTVLWDYSEDMKNKEETMKKTFLATLLAATLVVSLTACGTSEQPVPQADNKEEAPAPAAEEADPAKEAESAGNGEFSAVHVVIGQLGDKSFNDSAYNGLLGLGEAGWGTKVIELGRDQTKWEPTFLDLSEGGEYDLIITNGPSAIETVQDVAKEYPDQKFVLFDTEMEGDHPNIYAISYKQNEGAYLAGVLAALVTTSGMEGTNPEPIIGLIGGMEHPIITDWIVGYVEGARSVEPDIKVIVSYVGSWDDSAKGKELALAQYNQGADIIITPAETAALGCVEAAKESGKYIIGIDVDQSMAFKGIDEEAANCILTSILKNVDLSIIRAGKLYEEGTLPFGTFESLGILEDGVGVAYNEYYDKNVSQEIRDQVEAAKEDIVNGKIKVSSAFNTDPEEVDKIIEPALLK